MDHLALVFSTQTSVIRKHHRSRREDIGGPVVLSALFGSKTSLRELSMKGKLLSEIEHERRCQTTERTSDHLNPM